MDKENRCEDNFEDLSLKKKLSKGMHTDQMIQGIFH